jgi:hypothetical protein
VSASKFSTVLARIKDAPLELPPELPAESPAPVRIGRPPGKRSDPNWSPRTILMHRHTHKRVARILLDIDDPRDLSELIDELLRVWIDAQGKNGWNFIRMEIWIYG